MFRVALLRLPSQNHYISHVFYLQSVTLKQLRKHLKKTLGNKLLKRNKNEVEGLVQEWITNNNATVGGGGAATETERSDEDEAPASKKKRRKKSKGGDTLSS